MKFQSSASTRFAPSGSAQTLPSRWATLLVPPLLALAASHASAVALGPVFPAAPTDGCGQNFCDYFSFTSPYAISDIVRFNVDNNSSGGMGWGFDGTAAGENDNVLSYGSPNGINNVFFMGLADEGDGQAHVVLFSNSAFAANAAGQDWSVAFADTAEATVASDLQTLYDPSASSDASNAALNTLYNFAYVDGAVGGPLGGVSFTPNGSFSVIAYSNGTVIGSGYASEVTAAVPEPQSLAMVLAGAGLVGMTAMWRRQAKARPATGVAKA